MRNGGVFDEKKHNAQWEGLANAWAKDGLFLAPVGGRWGQSFDAQRLISFARKQGREMPMVEEIYSGNHEKNIPLSDWKFLLEAAERAGVKGAEEMLKSDQEVAEVKGRIQHHINMGISAVPVLVINNKKVIHGAPEHELLDAVFADEIKKATSAM